jgi:hypothetical protein
MNQEMKVEDVEQMVNMLEEKIILDQNEWEN